MTWEIRQGDVIERLREMPDGSVHCCVTSPPYWNLRDYGVEGQIGLEPTLDEWVAKMVEVFGEVRRVLRDDGTLWLNLGDSYSTNAAGNDDRNGSGRRAKRGRPRRDLAIDLPAKNLLGQPWRVAFALQANGWILRSDIIWAKSNPMPESVTDRPTKSHEHIFLLTKSPRYFWDADAVREKGTNRAPGNKKSAPGFVADPMRMRTRAGLDQTPPMATRNLRDVWTINPQPFDGWIRTCRLDRVEPDDASGDMMRIASPDCPAHGDCPDRVPTEFCDEHAVDETNRILGTHGRPALTPRGEIAPTDPLCERWTATGSSGCVLLSRSDAATRRSMGSRRTDRAQLTTSPCSASARTPDDTHDTSGSPASYDSAARTRASSTSAGSGSRELETSSDRTQTRTGDRCTCTHYSVDTKKTSHFATFPEALAERCIKAGTSESGSCPSCGAPWRRVVEKGEHNREQQRACGADSTGGYSGTATKDYASARAEDPSAVKARILEGMRDRKTLGWSPTCECRDETDRSESGTEIGALWRTPQPVPCTVLDPFAGSGTTLLVAERLGRDSIGIELNPEYVEMARQRINRADPMAPTPLGDDHSQGSLFA